MTKSIIDSFYESHSSLVAYLTTNGQVSYSQDAGDNFRRTLILAIASYFESEITDIVKNVAERYANGHAFICSLIEQKAISRQYHTYFDWEKKNANKFFSLFGSDFQKSAEEKVKKDGKLSEAVKDFLELGKTRNHLVHLNFITYPIELTAQEVLARYKSAEYFIAFLKAELLPVPSEEGK